MSEAPKTVATRKKVGRKPVVHTPGVFLRRFQKPDGSWYEGDIWQICYPIADPKRPGKTKMRFESSKSKNKTDAEKLLGRRKAETLFDLHPEKAPKKELTFKEFIEDHYLKDCGLQRGINEKTHVCNQIKKHFGRWPISAITAQHVENYRRMKREDSSPSTANRHLAIIKHMYTIASDHRHKFISKEKMAEIHSIKLDEKPSGRIKYLTKPQLKHLLEIAATRSSHIPEIMEFAAVTGLRKGRILQLEWSHVDIENGLFHIPKDKSGDTFGAPLHPRAIEILKKRQEQKHETLPYVFYNPDANERWKSNSGANRGAFKAAGLDGFRFHDLRHTFISHLVMAGVDIRTVQQLAGHKTLVMTLRYSHLSPNHVTRAINMLSYDDDEKTEG